MKKTIAKRIAALVFATALAVPTLALAACKENSGHNPNDPGTGGDELRSEKVNDAAAWKAAFDFSGVTSGKCDQTFISTVNGVTGRTNKFYIATDDNIAYSYYADVNAESGELVKRDEQYVRYEADELWNGSTDGEGTVYEYLYDDDDEAWYYTKYSTDRRPMATMAMYVQRCDELKQYLAEGNGKISDLYARFVYDDTKGLYVYELAADDFASDEISAVTIMISIKNGKLHTATILATGQEGDINYETETQHEYSDLNSTTLTLPEGATEKQGD